MSTAQRQYTQPPASSTAVSQAHHCPVPGCQVLCSPGHVSCRQHWRAVPQELRDPLIVAFRQRAQDERRYQQARQHAQDLVLTYAATVFGQGQGKVLDYVFCNRCGRGWSNTYLARQCAQSHQ